MAKKYLIFMYLFALLMTLSIFTIASGEEARAVIATGVADGKSSRARDEAINDALRKAVEQGVGTFVTTELTVEQQRLVDDRIYTESRGYIQQYKVLKEGANEGLYEVKISALVKMGKLAGDLQSMGLLIRKKQNPRVMVIIYSREVNSSFLSVSLKGNQSVENQVESGLLEKGFKLVDAGQLRRKKELETLLLKGDPSRASKIAKDFGAEILVQGEVRRSFVDQRQIFGRTTRFFSNEIRLKALETDTAKILYSGYRTRPPSGTGALLPLEESTSELVDEMVAGILEQWRKDVFQSGSYELNLSKISFIKLSKFKDEVLKIRGVHDLQVRSFQSGHAMLEVKYQGPVEQLAEKISAIKNPSIEITGMQSNTIDIRVNK